MRPAFAVIPQKDNDMKEISAQIYRNAIAHHRNQIKFLCGMIRDGSGHKTTCHRLALNHAQEIKDLLRDWSVSYPIKQTQSAPRGVVAA